MFCQEKCPVQKWKTKLPSSKECLGDFRCTLHASSYRVRGILVYLFFLRVFFWGILLSSYHIFGEVCFGKGQTTDELKHMRDEQRRQEESRAVGSGFSVQLVIPIFPKDPDMS